MYDTYMKIIITYAFTGTKENLWLFIDNRHGSWLIRSKERFDFELETPRVKGLK